jgi:hypothetical protein
MMPDDLKAKHPRVFLSYENSTIGLTFSDARRSQLLYSWLHYTGMDEMNEIRMNVVNE